MFDTFKEKNFYVFKIWLLLYPRPRSLTRTLKNLVPENLDTEKLGPKKHGPSKTWKQLDSDKRLEGIIA